MQKDRACAFAPSPTLPRKRVRGRKSRPILAVVTDARPLSVSGVRGQIEPLPWLRALPRHSAADIRAPGSCRSSSTAEQSLRKR